MDPDAGPKLVSPAPRGAASLQLPMGQASESRTNQQGTVVRPLARAPELLSAGRVFTPAVRAHPSKEGSHSHIPRNEIRAHFENLVRASPCPKALLAGAGKTGIGSHSAFSPVAVSSKADQGPVLARVMSRSCPQSKQPVRTRASPLQMTGHKGLGTHQGSSNASAQLRLPEACTPALQSREATTPFQHTEQTPYQSNREPPSRKAVPDALVSRSPAPEHSGAAQARGSAFQPHSLFTPLDSRGRSQEKKAVPPSMRLQPPGIRAGSDWVGAFPAFSVAKQQGVHRRLAADASLNSDSCVDSQATEISEDERGSDFRHQRSIRAPKLEQRPSERSDESPIPKHSKPVEQEQIIQNREPGVGSDSNSSAGGNASTRHSEGTAAGLPNRDPQLAEGTSLEGREQPSAGQSIESIQQRSAAVPVPEDTEQDVPAAQEVANEGARGDECETGESEGELGMRGAEAILRGFNLVEVLLEGSDKPGPTELHQLAHEAPLHTAQADVQPKLAAAQLPPVGLLEDRLGVPVSESSGMVTDQKRAQQAVATSSQPEEQLPALPQDSGQQALLASQQDMDCAGEQQESSANSLDNDPLPTSPQADDQPSARNSLLVPDSEETISDADVNCRADEIQASLQPGDSPRLRSGIQAEAASAISPEARPLAPSSPPPTWTVTKKSPWRQDKPEDQPFTRQGDQSEGGLDLPETKESDGGGESPLDILARAVLDTSPSGGPKTRSNKAGGRPKKAEKAVQKKAEKAVQLPEQLEAIKAPQQGSVVQPLGTIDTTPKPSSRAAALSLLFSKGLEEKRASAAVVRPLSSLSAFTPYGAGSRKGLSSPRSITEKANQPPHPDASGPQNLAQDTETAADVPEPSELSDHLPEERYHLPGEGDAAPSSRVIEQCQTPPQPKKRKNKGERELDALLTSGERKRASRAKLQKPEQPIQTRGAPDKPESIQPENTTSQAAEAADQQDESDSEDAEPHVDVHMSPPKQERRLTRQLQAAHDEAASSRVEKKTGKKQGASGLRSTEAREDAVGKEEAAKPCQPKSPPARVKMEIVPQAQISRTGRLRGPPVAFWANEKLQRDAKSGTVTVVSSFEDCFKTEQRRPAAAPKRAPSVARKAPSTKLEVAKPEVKPVSKQTASKPAAKPAAKPAPEPAPEPAVKSAAAQSKPLKQPAKPCALPKSKGEVPKPAEAAKKRPPNKQQAKAKAKAKAESSSEADTSEDEGAQEQEDLSLAAIAAAAGRAAANQSGATRDTGKAGAKQQPHKRQPGNSLEAKPPGAAGPSSVEISKKAAKDSSSTDKAKIAAKDSGTEASKRPTVGFMRKRSRLQQMSLPETPAPPDAAQQTGKRSKPSGPLRGPPAKKARVDPETEVELPVPKSRPGKCGIGMYPRCKICKHKRGPQSYCGTDTALPSCLNLLEKASAKAPKPSRPPGGEKAKQKGAKQAKGKKPGRPTKASAATLATKEEQEQLSEDKTRTEDESEDAVSDTCKAEEAGSEEDLEEDGWTESQVRALQAAWMRDVNPTAPGFWQRVAKKVPGSKTAAECHDKYMSLFGDTPAPKAAKARTAKPSAKLAAGKKPTKVQVRKMARNARLQQRTQNAEPSLVNEDRLEQQRRTERYLDTLLNRTGNKGFASAGFGRKPAQRPGANGIPRGAAKTHHQDLAGQMTSILAMAAGSGSESDDEEEKDHYFSE